MPRLIWAFVVHIWQKQVLSWCGSFAIFMKMATLASLFLLSFITLKVESLLNVEYHLNNDGDQEVGAGRRGQRHPCLEGQKQIFADNDKIIIYWPDIQRGKFSTAILLSVIIAQSLFGFTWTIAYILYFNNFPNPVNFSDILKFKSLLSTGLSTKSF